MIFVIIFVLVLYIGSFALLISGVTLYDVRKVKHDKAFIRHPHSRRFRKRPVVNVISENGISDQQQRNLKLLKYRKLRINPNLSAAEGSLVLTLPKSCLLMSPLYPEVSQLQSQTQTSITLLPELIKATTTTQLFHNYRLIASAPFALMRNGLLIKPHSLFPSLQHYPIKQIKWSNIYLIIASVAITVHALVLLYASVIAVLFGQTIFLFMVACTFSLWLLWAIITYPHLSWIRRIGYMTLSPASYAYFFYRSVASSFIAIRDSTSIIRANVGVIIKRQGRYT